MNLYQRLQKVAASVGLVHEGSKLPQNIGGAPAVGIDDVEQLLGPLFAEQGVIVTFAVHQMDRMQITEKQAVWDVTGLLTFVNADEPTEVLQVMVRDVGTTPTAAGSFAVKAAYRKMFHLVGGDPEEQPRQQESLPGGSYPNEAPVAQQQQMPQPHESQVQEADRELPATAPQIETIQKLLRLLGRPDEDLEGMNKGQAGARITALSRDYNKSKGRTQ